MEERINALECAIIELMQEFQMSNGLDFEGYIERILQASQQEQVEDIQP